MTTSFECFESKNQGSSLCSLVTHGADAQDGFKKPESRGGDGFVTAKKCFAEAIRRRGRPRPFLESTLADAR